MERFIRQAPPDLFADYNRGKWNEQNTNRMFVDTLNGDLRNQLWQQWQAQTPHQRGENYNLFGGAGRRV